MEQQLIKTDWKEQIERTNRIPAEIMPSSVELSRRCLNRYPLQYYNSLKPVSYGEVFDSPHISIGRYAREEGRNKAIAVMNLLLTDLTQFFSVGNSMKAEQILQTAEMIIDDCGIYKLDDFKLCFDRAKKGRYGEVYRIDGNVIFKWLNQYWEDRLNEAESLSIKEHQKHKQTAVSEDIKNIFRKKIRK